MLERTVIDTIVEVLDEHNISTADLVETGANVINNGVMMAVGDHAKIEQSDWQRAVDQPLADLRDAIDGFSGQPATRDALVAAQARRSPRNSRLSPIPVRPNSA